MKTVLLALALSILPFDAYAYCFEPSAPYCAERYGPFDSRYEFESCKREVESYLDELQDYARCVVNEIQEKQENAIDSFNRRANETRNSY